MHAFPLWWPLLASFPRVPHFLLAPFSRAALGSCFPTALGICAHVCVWFCVCISSSLSSGFVSSSGHSRKLSLLWSWWRCHPCLWRAAARSCELSPSAQEGLVALGLTCGYKIHCGWPESSDPISSIPCMAATAVMVPVLQGFLYSPAQLSEFSKSF